MKSIKTVIWRKSIVCRSLFDSLLKNEFNRLFLVDLMLCINTDVTRNTKNFNVDEVRLWTNKNENVNNESDVKKAEKKKRRFIVFDNCDLKRFDREATNSKKNEKLFEFCDRNLKLTKLVL